MLLPEGLQRLIQTHPADIGRQAEANAGRLREKPGENAPTGEKVMQQRGVGADPPLEQCTATQRRQIMATQQIDQTLAIAVQAFALTLLRGLIGQQLAASCRVGPFTVQGPSSLARERNRPA